MSYALVDLKTSNEVRFFDGDKLPDVVVWPNGDASHAVSPGEERAGCRFVKVLYDVGPPNEFYQVGAVKGDLVGDTVTFNRQWEPSDLEASRVKVLASLLTRAENAIGGLATQADLVRAALTPGPPRWAKYVAEIDELLANAVAQATVARSVDELAAAVATVDGRF